MNPELASIEALTSIAGVIKPKVTDAAIVKSLKLADRLAERLRKWMLDPVLKSFELPPERDPAKTFDLIGNEYSADTSLILGNAYDSVALEQKIRECRAALTEKYPVQYARDKLQDLPLENSPDEDQDWLALVSVIEDEYRILDEIEMGTLTPEQVQIYSQLFPELYGNLAKTAHDVIIEYDGKQELLPEIVESTLEIFLAEDRVPQMDTAAVNTEQKTDQTVELSSEKTQSENAEA